jgi:hypothetical protein
MFHLLSASLVLSIENVSSIQSTRLSQENNERLAPLLCGNDNVDDSFDFLDCSWNRSDRLVVLIGVRA